MLHLSGSHLALHIQAITVCLEHILYEITAAKCHTIGEVPYSAAQQLAQRKLTIALQHLLDLGM